MVLALDVGTRTIGLARTDPTRRFVFPDQTIARRSVVKDVAAILQLCKKASVVRLVVGLPEPEPGEAGSRSIRLARQVGDALAAASGLPLEWMDEGFTTVEADARLAAAGVSTRKRRGRIDSEAAAVILEDWLVLIRR